MDSSEKYSALLAKQESNLRDPKTGIHYGVDSSLTGARGPPDFVTSVSEQGGSEGYANARRLPFEILYIVICESEDEGAEPNLRLPMRVMDKQPGANERIGGLLFLNSDTRRRSAWTKTDSGQILFGSQTLNVSIELKPVKGMKMVQVHRVARAIKARIVYKRKARKSQNREDSPEPREVLSSSNHSHTAQLHIRGGCLGKCRRKKKFEDDEAVSALLWWVAGGKLAPDGSKPTGKGMREWKQNSKGIWDEGRERGFFQECAFVLSNGKICRNQRRKKQPEPPPESPEQPPLDPPTDPPAEASAEASARN
ncbi:hypothetical protein CPC735_017680 [Coccidioides posadasii C735 delta SOWgp]|uniref:Uncharacterized protein n=1 Tax=Coccidioides posadasii (strain C735) TaxID=222929 RepID=C5PDK5_COCP7|nr:hypothetical protein CPC735_017680 [Coccidioides posadasii C735 delta SOWgp]EER25166.1 hypothetical protein CPC735_017680 [Coccidioides posadasii C735 delta SOWgp]|eukprot:XP_003067311.1 hypothetical protein CPC735_017680 [Coccidioides posadasii C735 delta SOWgp]